MGFSESEEAGFTGRRRSNGARGGQTRVCAKTRTALPDPRFGFRFFTKGIFLGGVGKGEGFISIISSSQPVSEGNVTRLFVERELSQLGNYVA